MNYAYIVGHLLCDGRIWALRVVLLKMGSIAFSNKKIADHFFFNSQPNVIPFSLERKMANVVF